MWKRKENFSSFLEYKDGTVYFLMFDLSLKSNILDNGF